MVLLGSPLHFVVIVIFVNPSSTQRDGKPLKKSPLPKKDSPILNLRVVFLLFSLRDAKRFLAIINEAHERAKNALNFEFYISSQWRNKVENFV